MRAAGRSEDLSAAAIRKVEGGFPHSEIPGSKLVRSSPRLIAAYHVLHRLSAPRHPPNTLKALDRSHYRCSPLGSGRFAFIAERERYIDRKTICFKCIRERRGQADVHLLVCSAAPADFTCDRHTIGCTSSSRCRITGRRIAAARKLFAGQESIFVDDAPLVEPDGIEPTTSCLQSTRSPN